MNNGKRILILVVVAVLMPFMAVDAVAARWKLYDDFESKSIDYQTKWSKADAEDGVASIKAAWFNKSWQAKFTYLKTRPNEARWLYFNPAGVCAERITGIKAKVTIAPGSSTRQEGTARIGFHPGIYDDYFSWAELMVTTNHDFLNSFIVLLDQDNRFQYVRDLYWTHLEAPVNVINHPFTIYAYLVGKNRITVGIEGQGEVTYKLPGKGKFGPRINFQRGLSIRVWSTSQSDGKEDFSAYFDDVYIMTRGRCDKKAPKIKKSTPAGNARSVNRSTKYLALHFSEPMQPLWQAKATGGWELSAGTKHFWSADRKTLLLYRDNAETPLKANTTVEITFNPRQWLGKVQQSTFFRDVKGNLMKEYRLKFTTGY